MPLCKPSRILCLSAESKGWVDRSRRRAIGFHPPFCKVKSYEAESWRGRGGEARKGSGIPCAAFRRDRSLR